jgi:ribosomal protein L32
VTPTPSLKANNSSAYRRSSKYNEQKNIEFLNVKQKPARRRRTWQQTNEHRVPECKTKAHMKAAHHFVMNGSISTQRWVENPLEGGKTQIRVTKASKSKTKHKHVREGAQHSTNETKIKTVTSQSYNIKCLSYLHVRKDQRGPPQQRECT